MTLLPCEAKAHLKFYLWPNGLIKKQFFCVVRSIHIWSEKRRRSFPITSLFLLLKVHGNWQKTSSMVPNYSGKPVAIFLKTCSRVLCLECPIVKEARFKRIRRLKKFLRPLPRRSNVHRYPILKWFADTAYQRSFLWSFKGGPIQAALFWGIWISMLPIVGIQMIVVFFVSLFVRANFL